MIGVTQEIGVVIDLSKGIFENTIYKDGVLQLSEIGVDDLGQVAYAEKGTWTSSFIPIQDKIQAFKNVVKTINKSGGATHITSVSVSDDGFDWSEFVEVAIDGAILNTEIKKFAKVKIELFGGLNLSEMLVDYSKYQNDFSLISSNQIRIKYEYDYEMTLDNLWSGEGVLHRKKINRGEWLRIDSLNVDRGEK